MLHESNHNNISQFTLQHHYAAFGMHVDSSLPLPELCTPEQKNIETRLQRVTISECRSIETDGIQLEENQWLAVSENRLLFRINNVGSFLVSNGKDIRFERTVVDGNDVVLDKDLRVFILGSCFGAIALQNKLLPIHGSVVVLEKGAMAFVGDSGAGKSTMLGSFLACGYKMLTDDVCVLNFDDDRPTAFPAYPQCKYNKDSADLLGHKFDNMRWINRFKSKKYLDTADHFETQSQPLTTIIALEPSASANKLMMNKINGLEKFETIFRNTYRQVFHYGEENKKTILQQVANCTQNCEVYKLIRPTSKSYSPEEMVEFVTDFCASAV